MLEFARDNAERIVHQALSSETPDRLPICEGEWFGDKDRWRVRFPEAAPDSPVYDNYWADVIIHCPTEELFSTRIGNVKTEGEYVYRDDGWGRIVRTKPGTYFCEPVERILNTPTDLDAIEFDSPSLDDRYDSWLPAVQRDRDAGHAVFGKIGGPFIRLTFFRGEVEFLVDLATDEPLARAQVEKVGEHLLQVGLEELRRGELHNTGIWIYDDMCYVSAPMFSPGTFERVFLPTYKRMVSELKAAGARWVCLHCDGNLTPLLDLVVEAGIDGVNPVEHNAGMDAVQLIEKYHGRLAFLGGVCNTSVLPNGSPEEIQKHVAPLVEAGRNGGLVIGTHSIGPDIPIESYELYRRILAERGNYAAQV